MNKLIVGLSVGLILSLNASAKPLSTKTTRSDMCVSVSEFAKSIMERRQNGESITDIIGILDKARSEHSTPETIYNAANNIILKAFDKPLYSSDEYKQKAIIEFSNQTYISCMKDF